jgi:hypothetical protein
MYSTLDPKSTSELFLVRRGWFNAEYEVTDNVNCYGKLSYNLLSRRKATVVTANSMWMFKCDGIFTRTILILDGNGSLVGKATREFFSRITRLTLETGFQAEFYRPSVWSREYVWESSGYGRILHIKSRLFSLRDSVYIDQSMTPPAIVPLLIFFGAHLIILRRRRKAAHH